MKGPSKMNCSAARNVFHTSRRERSLFQRPICLNFFVRVAGCGGWATTVFRRAQVALPWIVFFIMLSTLGRAIEGLGVTEAVAAEWGDFQGRFVYRGEVPEPAKLRITKDREECCRHELVDESLVVDEKTGGIKNVVIYLAPPRNVEVPIHESYDRQRGRRPKLDNWECRFTPRVVLLWKQQMLVIGNSDPIGHNAMIDTRRNPPINVTIPSGGTYEQEFTLEEREPAAVSCSIHPWMRGWLLIRDTPYMAVTDDEGKFEIENLPEGEWEFVCWHEKAGYLTEVLVDGKATRWRRGRLTRRISSPGNQLGVVTVDAAQFRQ